MLFAVHPHSESTIITALLLFFLLWPSSEPLELLALALAAAFASASKYLLAFRGRHIVNPAAIGVVFVTVLGLTGGVWWIATAWMLPAVAVLGFLVAYRTRRLPMVGLFLAIAAGLIISFRLGAGDDITAALEYAFVSTPMVFFAGFMLTEPLTLPPLFRQQLAVAAGVAVLFALPNLVTDRAGRRYRAVPGGRPRPGQRGRVPARATARHRADPAGEAVPGADDRGVRLHRRRAGQLSAGPVHGGDGAAPACGFPRHPPGRSPSPPPTARPGTVSFGIKIPAEGSSSFKRTFAELPPGSRVQATTVGGDFLLPSDPAEPLLMVAGGIGITPFISHLAAGSPGPAPRDAVLVYAISDPDEVPYVDVLAAPGCGWCWSHRGRRATCPTAGRYRRAARPGRAGGPGAGRRRAARLRLRSAGDGQRHQCGAAVTERQGGQDGRLHRVLSSPRSEPLEQQLRCGLEVDGPTRGLLPGDHRVGGGQQRRVRSDQSGRLGQGVQHHETQRCRNGSSCPSP